MMPSNAISACILNTFKDVDSTTSLSSLFQYFETPPRKKFFIISQLNFPRCILRPFHLVLSLFPGRRDQPPPGYSLLSGSCRVVVGFSLSFFFSRLNTLSCLSCFSSDLCSRCFPSSVAFPWTYFSTSMSFFY